MHHRTERYIEKMLSLHQQALHNEFRYLEQKHHYFQQQDYESIAAIISQQQSELERVIRHFTAYQEHERIIGHELFNGHSFSREQRRRFHDLLTRDDLLVSFVTKHQQPFMEVLTKQQKALNHMQRNGVLGYAVEKYRTHSHHRLIDHLRSEEAMFSEYLDLMHQKAGHINKEFRYLSWNEHYDRIKRYVLESSAAATVLSGPVEIISAPFWGTYLSMEAIERLSHEFDRWRKVEKPRIFKEEKENH